MTRQPHILWADDEIDMLKPHILFLEGKGFQVTPVNSGVEALEEVEKKVFDLVFLDENMPGINGIETLQRIKVLRAHLPVIMITKSEEEHIMEEAIGSKISDYLIKPVNPHQILLAVKKCLDGKRLLSEKVMTDYQREFRELGIKMMGKMDVEDWYDVYGRLTHWTLELEKSEDDSMQEVLSMQFEDANRQFGKFIESNYEGWISAGDDGLRSEVPILSHRVLPHFLPDAIKSAEGRQVFLVVIDNLRLDQWRAIEPLLSDLFSVVIDDTYMSILPTATQYARNALFAGLLPADIKRLHPEWWTNEDEEGSKNKFEGQLLNELIKRLDIHGRTSYHKVTNLAAGRKLLDQFHETKGESLTTIVYNFVDMLSHARTDMEVIKELADDEAAYRSLTLTWFEHSALREMLEKMAKVNGRVIVTTDHGTVKVNNDIKVRGDKSTNSNLRYKVGKNLGYNHKEVFAAEDPEKFGLPKANVSSSYVFAKDRDFFVYPNNYHQFVKYFKDTFQHGGVSLEEVIVPFAILDAKN
jgi:CheY-like chemotaxis protein